MSKNPQIELGESLPRFVAHWIAASFGHFLMMMLPLISSWPAALRNSVWPAWWSMLLVGGATSIIAATINSNLPVASRELIKSVALGLALNATVTNILLS